MTLPLCCALIRCWMVGDLSEGYDELGGILVKVLVVTAEEWWLLEEDEDVSRGGSWEWRTMGVIGGE